MNNNELDPHYPVMPGMELPQNIKVEVHKGELEHLKRLADTAITDFARLEEESKNGVTCFHVTLVRNAHYYSGEGESEVTDIFREKKEISPKNDITFVNHNGFVEKTKVQKYYKISWRGITTTKAERPLYKFFVLNIK